MYGILTSTMNPVRMDLAVMAMEKYSTLLKSPELDLYHQMQFSVIPKTLKIKSEGM